MYDTCGSACPPTCDDLFPECTKECNAGTRPMFTQSIIICNTFRKKISQKYNLPELENLLLIVVFLLEYCMTPTANCFGCFNILAYFYATLAKHRLFLP